MKLYHHGIKIHILVTPLKCLQPGGFFMPYKDPEKKKEWEQQNREKRNQEKRDRRKLQSNFWLFIVYPDSAPENWKARIAEMQVEILISPLHTKDVNPDGTPKKPHWHGIAMFDSKKSLEQMQEMLAWLNGPTPIKPKGSLRSAARYLIHADNPEKAQYDKDEVLEFGGADFEEAILRGADKYGYIGEMMDWCDEQGVRSYAVLLRYARNENQDWFRCLCDNGTYVMKEYLKTVAYDDRAGSPRVGYYDPTLGGNTSRPADPTD